MYIVSGVSPPASEGVAVRREALKRQVDVHPNVTNRGPTGIRVGRHTSGEMVKCPS
jgi:hypothetical protein